MDGGGPGGYQPDGSYKPGCKKNENLNLSKNVAWKVGGYGIKGDSHRVDGNLALDMKQPDDDETEADPDDDEDNDCPICKNLKGIKMPFVRKNGCTTLEDGTRIPCIQNEKSELINNAFMFANGDNFKDKFDANSICTDNSTFTTCPRNKKLPTKGRGYYQVHAGKRKENNYYGDVSYDCGEVPGNGTYGSGWKVVVNGTTFKYPADDLYDPKEFLDYFVDIYNYDFRPDNKYPNNPLTSTGAQIGPYPAKMPRGEAYYSIPGRREEKASFPIPNHNATIKMRQEFMFRPAYG